VPFKQIAAPNLAAAAAAQIRQLIVEDVLRPGDQLPGERDLSARMGVSRTSLRSALQTLIAEGLLISRHGAALRVADTVGAALSDPLTVLLQSVPGAVFDYLRFRAILEGECAALAAEHATDPERRAIHAILGRMEAVQSAPDPAREAALDTEFHMAIVEAAGNRVAIQVVRSLHELLRRGIAESRALVYGDKTARDALLDQHRSIADAIAHGNAAAARRALHDHLRFVEETTRAKADEAERNELSERRRAWAEETG